jgi:NADH-quinone oxidoreductase subunit L
VGILLAAVVYLWSRGLADKLAAWFKPLYVMSYNKWFMDELYHRLFVRPTLWLGYFFWKRGDEQTINRYGPDGAAKLVMDMGDELRPVQTGYIYHYAFFMIVAICALMTWFFVR